MKKLKLDLNDLKVESFETNPLLVKRQGTVQGYNTLTNDSCDGEACQETYVASCFPTDNCNTCDATCVATCDPTCGATCGCQQTGSGSLTKYCCTV